MVKKYLSLMLLLVVGCTTTITKEIQLVSDNYKTVIFDDGINLAESKIIAQRQLVKRNVADIYTLSEPQEARDILDLPGYKDYWFIFFEEKKPSSIPFIFMTVINKKSGKVKFSEDYNEGNEWILEAAFLR